MGESWFTLTQAGVAIVTSCVALVFSGYSLYTTVLKQPVLGIYQPPLIYMYRQGNRDVFAIPLTVSNDGARRGTVLSFDLEITQPDTRTTMKFQNRQFGASPGVSARLFTPITIAGRSSFSDVVLFYAVSPGSFVEQTGSVRLPLTFTLRMNVNSHGNRLAAKQPPSIAFEMTASYIKSLNDMEAGRPTELLDARLS
jgi:hypothetical protein